ncbi:class I SAM-dependent methyltransferase [Planomonospora parontospora]|uniref:class I SAM-dependent methyltransferase n=1 Tax=Planomonospora parontospora TaxID=58119 RepID=UPI001E52F628|nr:class I SAM-dependent methyltransferase [Planomonospora parontospora]
MDSPAAFGRIDPGALAPRASSFGGQAAAYARERPGYPADAVRWALEPVSGGTPPRLLDLGAGTGKLTEVLVRQAGGASAVVAVEPDPAMLGELRRALPEVRSLPGSAEEIPLPDGSVDAVLVGQAMHWFDLDRALPEMRRVLAPGGMLAGLWNLDDDRVPWVRGLKETAASTVSLQGWRSPAATLEGRGLLGVEQAEFAHGQRRTAASMAATIGTHSHVLTMPGAERAELMDRIRAYLDSTPETSDGEFELPIVTVAVRARIR